MLDAMWQACIQDAGMLLSGLHNRKSKQVPLVFLFVVMAHIPKEVHIIGAQLRGQTTTSHVGHLVGAVVGTLYGFVDDFLEK